MFSYYGQPLQGLNSYSNDNPFETAQPQQQQGGMPMGGGGMGGLSSMLGGQGGFGSMFGGGAAGGGSAAGGAASSGAASGGSSAGSALSSAGPWAALAAVIIGNEYNAKGQGRRSEDGTQYAKDVIGGKVVEQDMPYFAKKVFGDDDYGFGEGWKAFGDFSTGDFSNAFGHLENRFKKLF